MNWGSVDMSDAAAAASSNRCWDVRGEARRVTAIVAAGMLSRREKRGEANIWTLLL